MTRQEQAIVTAMVDSEQSLIIQAERIRCLRIVNRLALASVVKNSNSITQAEVIELAKSITEEIKCSDES